jgi:hypothetical protein
VTTAEAIKQISDALQSMRTRIVDLEQGIRDVKDAWENGDDKCWKDLEKLFSLLPEGYVIPQRDESVELSLCQQYIKSCHHPGVKYVSPQKRIEELEYLLHSVLNGNRPFSEIKKALGVE